MGQPDVIPAEGHHRRLASMREVIHDFLDGVIDGATTVVGPRTRRLETLLDERWGRRAVATSSVWAGKNAGGLGDGGIVVVKEEENLVVVERLRNLVRERDDRYVHHSWGSRARLSELDAAVPCHQIPMLSVWNERRRLTADCYDKAFADLPLQW